jgi:DNA-binding response OmpR family regulator
MKKAILILAIATVVMLLPDSSSGGVLVGHYGYDDYAPQVRLISPVGDTINITGSDGILFKWSWIEGNRFERRYYDFRIYKGYDMLENTLIFKAEIAPDTDRVFINAGVTGSQKAGEAMHHSESSKNSAGKKVLIVSSDKNLRDVMKFCLEGWNYSVIVVDSIGSNIALVKKIYPDIVVVDVHTASRSRLDLCRLLKDDFGTASIPVITLINKKQLRSQLLDVKQGVDDYLIKPPDPMDLRIRIEMAMRRSQYSFYATPLTGLPGGRIIEEALGERLRVKTPFSFGYLDIDNFKYFNDVYGYLKGDRAIMQTAYMLYSGIRRFGNKEDFIGHIGGDDFVFITSPDKFDDISRNLIGMFNKLMPFHYTEDDRRNGYLVAKDRTHIIKKIPLMSISVAIVNRGEGSEYTSTIEINEAVAEIKRYLKTFPGSKFMAERRNDKSARIREPQSFTRDEAADAGYKPLGQLLLERGLITPEKLDEALAIHWKRGILSGEVMRELGFVTEMQIVEALNERKATLSV